MLKQVEATVYPDQPWTSVAPSETLFQRVPEKFLFQCCSPILTILATMAIVYGSVSYVNHGAHSIFWMKPATTTLVSGFFARFASAE
jgi:hypothetical protein